MPHIACLFVSLVTFWLSKYYVDGDQVVYRDVYENTSTYDLSDALAYYRYKIESVEIMHFLVCFLFGGWFPKDLLMSLINGILAQQALKFLSRTGIPMILGFLFVCATFYNL